MLAVKFHTGYSPSYYASVLDEDLQKFLSPWAFEDAADIILGGNIYANVLVNFMAELPYVDYIANMNLYQSYDGKDFIEAAASTASKMRLPHAARTKSWCRPPRTASR